MPDPIKKQIMDRIATNLAPLKPATFRDITRELDSTRDSKALPALMIYDGPEPATDAMELGPEAIGCGVSRVCRFHRISVPKAAKERVAAVA